MLSWQKIDSVGANKRSDFYVLWQHHKRLKMIEMMRFLLIFTVRKIFIISNLYNHSKNSNSAEEVPQLKTFSHGGSLTRTQRPSNQHKNNYKLCNENAHLPSMENKTIWSKFSNKEKATAEQIPGNKPKKSWNVGEIVIRIISSTRTGKSVLGMCFKDSKDVCESVRKSLLHINFKTIHMRNRIFSN